MQCKKTDIKSTEKLRVKKLADVNGSYYLDWFQNGKQTSITLLPMNPQAIALLGKRQADGVKVFDVPLQQTCDKALKSIAAKLKIKTTLHFHIARHSFGVILLENDVDIYKVSKLLGHKSVQTTIKHYDNITDKGAREAIDCFPEKVSEKEDVNRKLK